MIEYVREYKQMMMTIVKRIFSWLSIVILSWSLLGCSADTVESVQAFESESKPPLPNLEKITEVEPPQLIAQLNQNFVKTKPQVKILSPLPDQVLDTQNVEVKLEVKGLDLFKNEELQMGPHLHFFVDDQPYQAIYNTNKPIALTDLTPGTHTLRVFASRPWHESFKNRGAYAKTTFHIFTATEENNPSAQQPLLTYSRPQGVYGAQPIMLDFYLTDAPLHVVAQESPDDDIPDWRIRVTVNGESFLLDQWQPIYLEGFVEGQNWIKLEYIDENGNLIKNVFNSTVRAITYDPKLKDTLAKLVTGKISLATAQGITKNNYQVTPEKISPMPSQEVIPPTPTPPIVEQSDKTELEEESIPVQIEELKVEETSPPETNNQANDVEQVQEEIMMPVSEPEPESEIDESLLQTEDLKSEIDYDRSEESLPIVPEEQSSSEDSIVDEGEYIPFLSTE